MRESESEIQKNVRLAFSKQRRGVLLRYNVGTFLTMNGRPVRIGEPGVSDLIGLTTRVIQPEDVGKTVAVFTALETKKKKGGRVSERQDAFINRIKELGGYAGIVRSVEDMEEIIDR